MNTKYIFFKRIMKEVRYSIDNNTMAMCCKESFIRQRSIPIIVYCWLYMTLCIIGACK